MHLAGRHEDGVAVVRELVGNVLLLEAGDGGASVLFGQIGKQHGVIRLAAPQDDADDQRNAERQRSAGGELLALGQIADVLQHLREGRGGWRWSDGGVFCCHGNIPLFRMVAFWARCPVF